MSSDNSAPKVQLAYSVSPNYREALEVLRKSGYSIDGSLTKVSTILQAIRDAWSTCEATKHLPFPGEG